MKSLTQRFSFAALSACSLMGCAQAQHAPQQPEIVIRSEEFFPRPPFTFKAEDEKLLDEIQRTCFDYFWNAGISPSFMIPDRTSTPVVSVAGVGFQLSSICIGVERGWITKDQGRERVLTILNTLKNNADNRKAGMFYHFVSGTTGGQPEQAYEHVVSTIDSALLFSGILTCSTYFGGDVKTIGDQLFADADWRFFVMGDRTGKPHEGAFLSLAWKPTDNAKPTGEGSLVPYTWIDCGDEHRLVVFLAASAPKVEHRVEPRLYYLLRRTVGEAPGIGTIAYMPWSGAIFTNQFAHCWLNYSAMGTDNPAAWGVKNRPSVDWWENARRQVKLHQLRCKENPLKYPGFAEFGWALTAGDREKAYQVPGVFPKLLKPTGWLEEVDFAAYEPKDDFGDGTIAPYGPGSTIIFNPADAIDALRTMRGMKEAWHSPKEGGFGFRSFNLATGWVDPDVLAIEHGPLVLGIENARTGLLWRLFHDHPYVQQGMDRLKLKLGK